MNSTVLLATLHHLAAFTVVAMLAVEAATFRPPFSALQARRLQRVDLMRVTWLQKGPAYHWHDLFFLIKFGAFIAAALISIYPMAIFLSWTRALKSGEAPPVSAACATRVRLCLMLELTPSRSFCPAPH